MAVQSQNWSAGSGAWYPDDSLKSQIEFVLVDKRTQEVITSNSGTTWWLTSWNDNPNKRVKKKDMILYFRVKDLFKILK